MERAKALGMAHGASDAETYNALVRDVTGGLGADRTLITAATKSNALINLSMDVTRRKGTVVIVGDIGLKVEREVFYRKEIDLLASTSCGRAATTRHAGRRPRLSAGVCALDRKPEHAVMRRADCHRPIDIQPLIDRVISVDDAPSAAGSRTAKERCRSAC